MRRPLVVYYRCGGGISIHAPREGCDYFYVWSWRYVDISIHAPREGCDWITSAPATKEFDNFNPRTPRGVRQDGSAYTERREIFQSTHPARGATRFGVMTLKESGKISIHAPREGCDAKPFPNKRKSQISIHAPREGCDLGGLGFLVRGNISIHAPREGCDGSLPFFCCINC